MLLISFSDLLQITDLTEFLIEHWEILGENIPNLLDIYEGTLSGHTNLLTSPPIRDCLKVNLNTPLIPLLSPGYKFKMLRGQYC